MTFKSKIISDYWVNKLKKQSVAQKEQFQLTTTKKLLVSKDKLGYFYKISNGNLIAEYTILCSIYSALLQRYFDSSHFIYSAQIGNVNRPVLLDTIIIENKSLKEYLQQVKQEVQEAYKYADYGDDLSISKEFKNYTPFGFSYNTTEEQNEIPFFLQINKTELGLTIAISFSEVFKNFQVVNHFAQNVESWLINLEDYLEKRIYKISTLSEEEKQEVLTVFNSTDVPFPFEKTITDLFEDQVHKTPENVALVIQNKTYTYKKLNQEANALASYLIEEHGINVNDLVGVKLERSEKLIVSLLAVLKTGAAYVPIDKNYPEERIKYIENDSQCKLVIEDDLDFFTKKNTQYSKENIAVEKDAKDLAYIIYTSGTTGKPKGVMITHQNAVAMICWAQKEFDLDKHDIVYAVTSHCFDLSVYEIFYTLSTGKKIRLLQNALEIGDYLDKDKKILINTVPSSMRSLIEKGFDLQNVAAINLAGEPFPVDIGQTLLSETQADIRNLYGPSEDTTYSTYYKLSKGKKYITIPIGKPLHNTQAFILDTNLELVPLEVTGKLYLSGLGVTKGYLNREELTSQKYIPNPFIKGERMYDTGDLAYWMPDGNIGFLGRKDHQIKLRGYRIELGEIENEMLDFSDAIQRVVVSVKEVKSEKVLVGYYVGGKGVNKSSLRSYLALKLPSYMIPSYFVKINKIPLTPNGKINRDALPEVSTSNSIKSTFVAPRNKVEEELKEIWEDITGIDNISVKDDFFKLGGHSLVLSKLLNTYHKTFNVKLRLQNLYNRTTLEEHAYLIQNGDKQEYKEILKTAEQELYELSLTQMRFWLIYKIQGKSKEFNMFRLFDLPEELDHTILEQAFNDLLLRHEALRTVYVDSVDKPKQKIIPFQKIIIPNFASEEEAISSVFDHEFDLEEYPLFRIGISNQEEQSKLFFNVHHSICDGWSQSIAIRDMLEIYEAKISNTPANLPQLFIQYKDYAVWQNETTETLWYTQQGDYWKKQLSGKLSYLQLPTDYNISLKTKNTNSGYYTIFLDSEAKQKITRIANENAVSIFAFYITAMKIWIRRLTSQEDVIIGVPSANRNHHQLKDIVGCFLNTLMLRNTVDPDETFLTFLKKVNQTLLKALENQNYPFEQILEDLNIAAEDRRFPISPVFVNMLDFDANTEEIIDDFSATHGQIQAAPKFDIECYLKSFQNGLMIKTVYNSERFKPESIEYWISEIISIIHQVVENNSINIKSLNIFDNAIEEVLDPLPSNDFEFFETEEIYQNVAKRFENQVDKYPDHIAVHSKNKRLSYLELNAHANQLANQILDEVDPQTERIALLLNHDETCVIGMLGVLKSGFSYVPIDVDNPNNRILFILKDSGSNILICNQKTYGKGKELQSLYPGLKVICLEEESEETVNLNKHIEPFSEAYVLYTSGSTGKPKGVIQTQLNMLHYIRVYTNNCHISNKDNLSVFSTYTFDASIKDIYGAILNGATVSMYDMETDGLSNLADWLADQHVSIMHMVPTLFRYFIKELEDNRILESVRLLDMGGEASYHSDFQSFKKHFPQGAFFVNDYGPTEATIISQKFLTHSSEWDSTNISLGKPVVDTEVFIWDENQKEKGIYQIGEIVFKSKFISLGYLNREELTRKAFISNLNGEEKRIYKSGDIGRMLPNKEIEFLHRKDSQVKLNGLRIELPEIEFQLEQLQSVQQAVVMLREIDKRNFLTAYLKVEEELNPDQIKSTLKELIPRYMIPSVYIFMEEFPLTRTGKIDRKSLPIATLSDIKKTPYKAPEGELEYRLVEVWGEILKIETKSIGVHDNFFELGGHSLNMNKMLNSLKAEYKVNFNYEEFYYQSTIKYLAMHIENVLAMEVNDSITVNKKIIV